MQPARAVGLVFQLSSTVGRSRTSTVRFAGTRQYCVAPPLPFGIGAAVGPSDSSTSLWEKRAVGLSGCRVLPQAGQRAHQPYSRASQPLLLTVLSVWCRSLKNALWNSGGGDLRLWRVILQPHLTCQPGFVNLEKLQKKKHNYPQILAYPEVMADCDPASLKVRG